MAYDFQSILEAQGERIARDQAIAVADLEAARLSEDPEATNAAAQRILELDTQRVALFQRAQQFTVSQQTQPQGSKWGLSADEVETAKNCGISEEEYFSNKQRMQAMQAQGYWSQGSVKR